MKLDTSDIADLRPLIAEAVRTTLAELQAQEAKLASRLGYPESEAAGLLGIPRHVLRDARLRGEITGRLIGKKIVYSRDVLQRFLADGKPKR